MDAISNRTRLDARTTAARFSLGTQATNLTPTMRLEPNTNRPQAISIFLQAAALSNVSRNNILKKGERPATASAPPKNILGNHISTGGNGPSLPIEILDYDIKKNLLPRHLDVTTILMKGSTHPTIGDYGYGIGLQIPLPHATQAFLATTLEMPHLAPPTEEATAELTPTIDLATLALQATMKPDPDLAGRHNGTTMPALPEGLDRFAAFPDRFCLATIKLITM